MKTTGKVDLRRAYFHMCMDSADCSTSCQAMGAGSAKWIKAKINDKGKNLFSNIDFVEKMMNI